VTVPYCDGCDRFYNPNTLDPAGDCPEGHHVADPGVEEEVPPVPWHFKLMLALLVAYLLWRFLQFGGALF
jgi:hypothetical protein